MPTWKALGYVIRLYETDHPPRHVHVYRDGKQVARYDLENGRFMDGDPKHFVRIRAALRQAGLIR